MKLKELCNMLAKKWLQDSSKAVERVPKGQGVFIDGDFIIANLAGARFKINGKVENTASLMPVSDQLYLNINGEDLAKQKLSVKEFDELKRAFTDVYGNDSSGLFYSLVGMCVQGILSGISPHRAHLWLNGGTGTGKTRIKEYFIEPLTERMCLKTIDATPAAIDQKLSSNEGHNAVLVTVDECGDDTHTKLDRIKQLLTLARELAVTQGLGSKMRGTASQEGKTYNRTASMLMCSTTNSLKDPQDISRFLVSDISKYTLDKNKLDALLETATRLADKFIYTAVTASEPYLSLFPQIRNALNNSVDTKMDLSHKTQALAAIITGFEAFEVAMEGGDMLNLEAVIANWQPYITEQVDYHISKIYNDTEVLDTIMLTPMRIDGVETNIVEYVHEARKEDQDKLWEDYGIRGTKKGGIMISLKRFKVPNLFKNYTNKRVHISKDKLIEVARYSDRVKKYSTKIDGKYEWVVTIA